MRLYATPRFAPLPDTQRIHWPAVADELHARPGEWAAIGTQNCGRHPLNRDKLATLGLECTSRSNGDGTWTIWMRGVEDWAPERVEPGTLTVGPLNIEVDASGLTTAMADAAAWCSRFATPPAATHKWFRGERRTTAAA